ncbi:DUF6531 domain-containing protein [Actinomadura rayongensis]|uniref:Type IV secretion protein Rhs n=1 Tax=Actinomadura rayongensis TaxID=1429076 RepID=A0A6I4VXS0_9ACTN|nr:DUF6531 domain-containing protein [Actinomadura rayongensis]MXQ63179.1 type IV secretion protein Rhs [Actinomadura rayongensis]
MARRRGGTGTRPRGGGKAAGGIFGKMAERSFRAPKGAKRGGGGPGRPKRKGGQETPQRRRQGGRETARDRQSRTTTKDPIDVVTGEVLFTQTDVTLPGALPFEVERSHLSRYRDGGLFGVSWASTLDQRLEPDADGVTFLAADGMILRYPQALLPNIEFRPAEGPQWPLTLTSSGGYTLTDPRTGRTLHFPAPGAEHGWSALPLTAVTDRNGNRVDLVRADGVLTEIRHSGGYAIAVDTAPVDADRPDDRRITALRLICGPEEITLARYRYDAAGLLAEVIDESGLPLRFAYDDEHRLTRWDDRLGHHYRYEYDGDRAVAASGTGGFLDVRLAYSPGETVVTDALGHATTYRYDEALRVVAETGPRGGTIRSEWDGLDRLTARTDALGRTTRFGYDDRGNLTSVTRPDGATMTAVYNDLNLPVEVTEPGGAVWRRAYDERGNVVAVTDPAGATTRAERDERGNVARLTDPLGNVTLVRCDAAGLPVAVTGPDGAERRTSYDPLGRPETETDPLGRETRYGWTRAHGAAWRRGPDGATERWTYDAEGNVTGYTDAEGRTTVTEYGPFGTPVAQTDPSGARTTFAYDAELRITEVTAPDGRTWRYTRDAAGDIVAETDFNGRTVTSEYDVAGQLTARTNALGETIRFVRNALGDVVEEHAPEGVATFAYDPAGYLVRAANADADVRFERDALGRVVAETCDGHAVRSAYDPAGRRIARQLPGGSRSAWTFDAAGRPVRLDAAGGALRFHYDAAGREVRRDLGAGAILTQQWDDGGWLAAQTLWGANGPAEPRLLQHRAYTRRPTGTVGAVHDRLTGDRSFALDALDRVTAVQGRAGTERYAYDGLGNIARAEIPGGDGGEREHAGTLLRRAGSVRYEHDAHGRVTLRQRARLSGKPLTWRFTWDSADRLTGVTTPDGRRWRYRYDALGRRVRKERLTPDGAGVEERTDFVWDGLVVAEQVRQVWSPEHGAYLRSGTVWEHDPASFAPLAQTDRSPARDAPQQWVDKRFRAIVADAVGTPAELVDPAGAVAGAPRTTLWGAGASGGDDCPLRFPGQYHDAESGLNYNHHRYYDPEGGNYLSADPLGLAAALNPHAYVPNPLTWLDPLGLKGGQDGGEEKVTVYHYTDKKGYNGISSSDPYHVREGASKHGPGPFWTTKSPADLTEPGAFKSKLGITREKSEYVMEAQVPKSALVPIEGGRGAHIFKTPGGIHVPRSDSRYFGPTSGWTPA